MIKIMVLLHSAVGTGWQSPPKGTSLKTLGEAEEQGFILIRGEFQKRQFRLTDMGANMSRATGGVWKRAGSEPACRDDAHRKTAVEEHRPPYDRIFNPSMKTCSRKRAASSKRPSPDMS